jgi:hypothetical protein
MNNCFPVHFDELKPETQKQLLKFMGVADPADLNWDVFPVFQLPKRQGRDYDKKSGRRSYIWDLGDDDCTYYALDL